MGIADAAVRDRIEELPVIFRGIAVEQILQHVGDARAPRMRAIDVIVIDAVRREARSNRLAVARVGPGREAFDQCREFALIHKASC